MANGGSSSNRKPIKGKPVTVRISYTNGSISVDPDPVTVNWKDGPDSVEWKVNGLSGAAEYVAIEFPAGSCFKASGLTAGGRLLATVNTEQGGTYKYDVIVYDAEGEVVDSVDPKTINEPET